MKISHLIELLKKEQESMGDLEVFVEGSNAIFLDALPYYYDGGGDMLEGNDRWYSTKFNRDKSGNTILHIKAQEFNYGADDFTEYYDDVEYPSIKFDENWEQKYNEAREKLRKQRSGEL